MKNIFRGFLQGLGCLGCLILLPFVLSLSPIIALFLVIWGLFEAIFMVPLVLSLWADNDKEISEDSKNISVSKMHINAHNLSDLF